MTATLIRTSVNSQYDLEQIINSMLLAFNNDPFFRWLYPSQEEYLAGFPGVVRFLNKDKRLSIYSAQDNAGAAFWLSPGIELDSDAFSAHMQKTLSSQKLEKLDAALKCLKETHPKAPHWYLALLGVSTTAQGKGYGSALIQSALRECDLFNQIAYLETCNPKSAAFYECHGFELQEEVQVSDCPVFYTMVRFPQSI